MILDNFIKFFCIGFSSGFLFTEFLTEKPKLQRKICLIILYALLYSLIQNSIDTTRSEILKSLLAWIMASICFYKFCKEKFVDILLFNILAIAISYLLSLLYAFIMSLIVFFVFHNKTEYIVFAVMTGIIELITVFILQKRKIFMPFLYQKGFRSIFFLVAGSTFFIFELLLAKPLEHEVWILIAGACAVLACIYLLQQSQRSIQLNDKAQKQVIKKQKHELKDLTETHDFLAARVHKDNKSIAAIYNAVQSIVSQTNDHMVKEKAQKFLTEVGEMRRQDAAEAAEHCNTQSTDILVLDALIGYFNKIAAQNDIDFSMKIREKPTVVLNKISSEKLKTLIADLMENAIIALRNSDSDNDRKMKVYFDVVEGIYQFTVQDNGVPFEKKVLDTIGKQKITTHKDSGGSGIGYMTIFEILNLTKASLRINENKVIDGEHYKEVKVCFDDKKDFLINLE